MQRKRTNGSGSITTIASGSTDAYQPRDLVISGDYAYWTTYHSSSNGKVQRRRTNGSGSITTIASGSTQAYNPRDLVIDGDYAYWTNYGTSSNGKVQRARKDGTGSVQTIASGSTDAYAPRDLVIHGDYAHWTNYHSSSGKVQRMRKDGTGSVQTIASGGTDAYNPQDLVITSETETVASACVTDAGTLAADYASHPWNSNIDSSCPNSFRAFRLAGDADLRLSATASDTDPIPVLRRGGIDGEVVALTTAANGVATTYIHHAQAGEYTIEMALGPASARSSGAFSATLETQPALDGCDLNLGTLSAQQLQVYGKYDPDCGDTRKYFFYLEFQASISVSASGVGFTPRIELRPGSQSDAETPLAQDTQNPADIYQQVTSGSYRINLEAITEGDTYSLTFQAFGLPPPTRTPIPTPTPRFQPNVDVRMDPDPRSVRYEKDRVYRFRLEGGQASFPAIVRTGNRTAFPLTTDPNTSLDCTAGGQVDNVAQLQVVYLHVCANAVSSAVEVIKASDYSLLAQYPLYVAGDTPSTPDSVPVSGKYVAPPEDRIGLGILINTLCDGANVSCQVDLIRNGIGAAGSTVLFVVPTQVARGRASRYAYGIGIAGFIIGLFLANYLVGTPLWWGGVCVIGVIALFLAGMYLKFRRLGS